MIKALILARNQTHYRNTMRQLKLNPNEYRYVRGFGEIVGWWIDMPIILVQEYEGNLNYTLELMSYIGHWFDNIGYLTEREIWYEGTSI